MIKSYKVRIEPNNKQHARMMQFSGAARFAYNWALEQQDKNHKEGELPANDKHRPKVHSD